MAELPEGGRREEQQQVGEASQGVGAGAVVAMDERIEMTCEAGHVVCGACRASHGEACGGGAAYTACPQMDALLREAKVSCAFAQHGCASYVDYIQASGHERSCPWAPCFCLDPGCGAFTSAPRLAEHFRTAHPSWPVTEVSYGEARELPLPPQGQHTLQVLVGAEDRRVFLVSSSELGRVSVVCVRANGDAAAQFSCTLWVDGQRGGGNVVAPLTFLVASNDLSGGVAAAEPDVFLAVPLEMVHDESGEARALMVRIDKAGGAAASSTHTPAARSSGSQPEATA